MAMRLRHSRWHRDAVMLWSMNHSMHLGESAYLAGGKLPSGRCSSWLIIIVVFRGLAWWE